ncbi:hypothetical protein D1AOALGA4SA_4509 [Olavius algarvensis Delta 1 endosymbiont]|nr:hypothetical protein D1AOALGA4SA_4509 [Olavius algarvensis Delta 1 endosymbiont]
MILDDYALRNGYWIPTYIPKLPTLSPSHLLNYPAFQRKTGGFQV